MAGRKPLPTAMKVLQGTFQKCRGNPDEPQVIALEKLPEPPRKLKREARIEWERVIVFVYSNGIIGQESLSLLATYCNLHANVVEFEKKGEVPQAALLAQYRTLAAEFGLLPGSRTRIKSAKKSEKPHSYWDGAVENA